MKNSSSIWLAFALALAIPIAILADARGDTGYVRGNDRGDDTGGEAQGPQFAPDGKLLKPRNYRQWVNIGTGLNMAYDPVRSTVSSSRPPFTNVFVNPPAYRSFLQSGTWPDQTLFILEIRASVPVNKAPNGANGYFQGDVLAIEAHVKDEKRFPGAWAFFEFGRSGTSGVMLPVAAECYSCHAKNGAVDNTFVQFYPVLRDIAKEKGTIKDVPETF